MDSAALDRLTSDLLNFREHSGKKNILLGNGFTCFCPPPELAHQLKNGMWNGWSERIVAGKNPWVKAVYRTNRYGLLVILLKKGTTEEDGLKARGPENPERIWASYEREKAKRKS